jgi:nucleoside-triphosphatase THEP1
MALGFHPGGDTRMTTAPWALVSAESNAESSALALSVVERLEAVGIRTAGFTQQKLMNENGQKRYELVRLHSEERSLLAVDSAVAKETNEELFCSMVFHNDSFAAAQRWMEEDGRDAELLLFCGIGKLEAFDKGHSKLLERALERHTLILLCVKASQLSYVMERFALPEDNMVGALELPASSNALDEFVKNLKESCYAQRKNAKAHG